MTKLEKFEHVRALVKSGLSQTETARQMGLSDATVSRWVRDIRTPKGAAKLKGEAENRLTNVQQKNARAILNALAGGEFLHLEADSPTAPEPTDDELLANYVRKGGASPEAIATACAGVTWKDMRRATKNSRLQLNVELRAGFDRIAARELYIAGRALPYTGRSNNIMIGLGVAA